MFQLSIISLEKIEYRDKVDEVICPGSEGELSVLENHIPLITALKEGEITVKRNNQIEKQIKISRGVLEVKPKEVVLLITKI